MGHMKATRSNTRTTRSTTKRQNETISKDEDDGSIPVLAPPRTQLELEQGHHVAFGFIDMSTETHGLKGLVSTDLPGRFPFTSSKGNNYIMYMYDYDSNVIWSHPIKSRYSADLIIGINACYKVLDDANITPLIHRLDNEISDDIIRLIKKKGLQHQVVTAHDH